MAGIKPYRIIGIDGIDDSGKTYLSKVIGKELKRPVLSLDEYLVKDKETYVENLRYDAISALMKENRLGFIIEGICLLDILKKLRWHADCLIYIKRINTRGEWLDEDECLITDSIEERIKIIEDRTMMVAKACGHPCSGLTAFRKEVIRYHHREKPFAAANYIFERRIE